MLFGVDVFTRIWLWIFCVILNISTWKWIGNSDWRRNIYSTIIILFISIWNVTQRSNRCVFQVILIQLHISNQTRIICRFLWSASSSILSATSFAAMQTPTLCYEPCRKPRRQSLNVLHNCRPSFLVPTNSTVSMQLCGLSGSVWTFCNGANPAFVFRYANVFNSTNISLEVWRQIVYGQSKAYLVSCSDDEMRL